MEVPDPGGNGEPNPEVQDGEVEARDQDTDNPRDVDQSHVMDEQSLMEQFGGMLPVIPSSQSQPVNWADLSDEEVTAVPEVPVNPEPAGKGKLVPINLHEAELGLAKVSQLDVTAHNNATNTRVLEHETGTASWLCTNSDPSRQKLFDIRQSSEHFNYVRLVHSMRGFFPTLVFVEENGELLYRYPTKLVIIESSKEYSLNYGGKFKKFVVLEQGKGRIYISQNPCFGSVLISGRYVPFRPQGIKSDDKRLTSLERPIPEIAIINNIKLEDAEEYMLYRYPSAQESRGLKGLWLRSFEHSINMHKPSTAYDSRRNVLIRTLEQVIAPSKLDAILEGVSELPTEEDCEEILQRLLDEFPGRFSDNPIHATNKSYLQVGPDAQEVKESVSFYEAGLEVSKEYPVVNIDLSPHLPGNRLLFEQSSEYLAEILKQAIPFLVSQDLILCVAALDEEYVRPVLCGAVTKATAEKSPKSFRNQNDLDKVEFITSRLQGKMVQFHTKAPDLQNLCFALNTCIRSEACGGLIDGSSLSVIKDRTAESSEVKSDPHDVIVQEGRLLHCPEPSYPFSLQAALPRGIRHALRVASQIVSDEFTMTLNVPVSEFAKSNDFYLQITMKDGRSEAFSVPKAIYQERPEGDSPEEIYDALITRGTSSITGTEEGNVPLLKKALNKLKGYNISLSTEEKGIRSIYAKTQDLSNVDLRFILNFFRQRLTGKDATSLLAQLDIPMSSGTKITESDLLAFFGGHPSRRKPENLQVVFSTGRTIGAARSNARGMGRGRTGRARAEPTQPSPTPTGFSALQARINSMRTDVKPKRVPTYKSLDAEQTFMLAMLVSAMKFEPLQVGAKFLSREDYSRFYNWRMSDEEIQEISDQAVLRMVITDFEQKNQE